MKHVFWSLFILILVMSGAVHAAKTTYTCKALSEKENPTPIFSDLTLKMRKSEISISGTFKDIGSNISEKFDTTATQMNRKPKYTIKKPFVISVYLPSSVLTEIPESIRVIFSYSGGSNGFVKASGDCFLVSKLDLVASYQFRKNELNHNIEKAEAYTKMNLLFTSHKILSKKSELSIDEIEKKLSIKCRETKILMTNFEIEDGFLCEVFKK